VQLSDDAERELADQRMMEWSKDQEEYTEQQYQEIQKRRDEIQRAELERRARISSIKKIEEYERAKARPAKPRVDPPSHPPRREIEAESPSEISAPPAPPTPQARKFAKDEAGWKLNV
jgi:hypothetical protein